MTSGRPRGRPPKRRKRTDGERHRGRGDWYHRAGCIIYNIDAAADSKAAAQARSRARPSPPAHAAGAQPSVVAVDSRPRSCSAAERWVHESISKSSDTKDYKRRHPLVLATTIFDDRQISADCLQVALHWARFWAAGAHDDARFSRGKGFSLHAAKQRRGGRRPRKDREVLRRGVKRRRRALLRRSREHGVLREVHERGVPHHEQNRMEARDEARHRDREGGPRAQ